MAAIYPDLEGKSVLVTGGGSGIGASIVRAFARQKAKVGFLDIARDPSTRLVDELATEGFSVRYEYCDVTNIDHLRAAIDALRTRFGEIVVSPVYRVPAVGSLRLLLNRCSRTFEPHH